MMAPRVIAATAAATVRALRFAKTLNHGSPISQFPKHNATLALLSQKILYASSSITKSPFDANILRIINNRIELETEYPVPQLAPSFGSFTVQDQPGRRLVTMRTKSEDGEDIQIEATSFDAAMVVQMPDEDKSGQELRLHISMVVRVTKQNGEALQFICSAWPDSLSIQNVYLFQHKKIHSVPYMGPNFRRVDEKMQKAFQDFLETRGINNEVAAFLHERMTNKERSENIRWLQSLKTFYENRTEISLK